MRVSVLTAATQSDEDTDFLRHALDGYESLSPSQIARLHTFVLDLVAPFQAVHGKQHSGLIDPRLWETLRTDLAGWFKCPGMLAIWQTASPRAIRPLPPNNA